MVVDFPDSGLVAGVTEHIHTQTGTIFLWTGTAWVVKGTTNTGVQGGLPVGAIVSHSSQIVPPGYFECAGQSLERTAYPQLFAAIGTYWGQGDNPGTTFALPNFRGQFLRGWDNGEGIDAGRGFASYQEDEFEAHTHNINGSAGAASGTNPGEIPGPNAGIVSGSTGGSETRPKNYAVMFIIKAFDTVLNPGMIDVSVLAQFVANSQSQADFLNAQTGFIQLPDWMGGFIVNWGKVVSAVNGDTTNAVTFAKEYIAVPHLAMATIEGATGTAVLASAYITALTETGMNVNIDVSGAFSRNAWWFTVGK